MTFAKAAIVSFFSNAAEAAIKTTAEFLVTLSHSFRSRLWSPSWCSCKICFVYITGDLEMSWIYIWIIWKYVNVWSHHVPVLHASITQQRRPFGGKCFPPKNVNKTWNRRRQQRPRIDCNSVSAICIQLWRCTVTRASPAAPWWFLTPKEWLDMSLRVKDIVM